MFRESFPFCVVITVSQSANRQEQLHSAPDTEFGVVKGTCSALSKVTTSSDANTVGSHLQNRGIGPSI